jgi:hypothetical protein
MTELAQAWLECALAVWPPETARFLLREKDRFRNPVGYAFREGLPVLLEELLGEMNPARIGPALDEIVRIRKGHVEDWIAFIVANHLFAAADGYVAAHLWDLPSQINVSQAPNGGTVVAARIKW